MNIEQELDEVTNEADRIEEEILEVERRTSVLQEEAETSISQWKDAQAI